MKSIVIWGLSNYNWLWIPMAERFKKDGVKEAHMICNAEIDIKNWKSKDKKNIFDSHIEIGSFFDEYDNISEEYDSIVKKSRAYEEKYSVTVADALQSDRHLGRGFSAGGPGHARSELSNKSTYIKSLNMFNKLIQYWEDYFDRTNPDLLIGFVAGISGKTCTVVARQRGVKLRALNFSRYQSNFYWTKNENYTFPEVQDEYAKNEKTYLELANPDEVKALKRLPWSEKNYKMWLEFGTVKALSKKLINALKAYMFKKVNNVKQMGNYQLMEQFKIIFQEYRSIKNMNDFEYITPEKLEGKDYVFYPLHVEPESALSMLNPEFNEQLAIIEMTAKNLPAGVTLVIKDHIGGISRRPKDFFSTIRDIPNCEIAAPYSYALDFVRSAKAVIVITGTVGTESVLLGVPVISFSLHNGFNCLPDVYVVKSWHDLRPLLKRLCLSSLTIEDKERMQVIGLRYIAAIKAASFDLSFSDYSSKNRGPATDKELDALYPSLVKSYTSEVQSTT